MTREDNTILNITNTTWKQSVICPRCDCENVHIISAAALAGGPNEAQSATTIDLWCENDHEWRINLNGANGQVFIHAK